MSKGKYLFKQTEATPLIRAALAAGLTPGAIKVNSQGEIALELGEPNAQDSAVQPAEKWQDWVPADDKSAA